MPNQNGGSSSGIILVVLAISIAISLIVGLLVMAAKY